MTNIFKLTFTLCLLFFHTTTLFSQTEIDQDITRSKPLKLLIPQLNELIDSALVHNGMMNYRNLEIDAKEENIKSKRRNWTKNFGVQADTRFGTLSNFSTSSDDNTSVNLATNTTQFNYNVGFYLKVPIFDVINRNSEIKRAQIEIEQAKSLAKSQEDELKEVVIRYYEDLLLKQKLLELRAESLGNARVNMEMVEKEFRNGLVPIAEYVRITDMTSRIASEYEEAKSNLMVSKKLLENITGITVY
jgi:outer membrane protein TolC